MVISAGLIVPVPAGDSVSRDAGGPVAKLEGATDGASDSNAVQLLASKKGRQSNAQSVLLTSKHPLPGCSRTSRNPSSGQTELVYDGLA